MKKDRHIFLCTEDPGVGGVAQYNYSLLNGLSARGYQVTYVQNKALKDLFKQEKLLNISQIWIDNANLEDFIQILSNVTSKPDLIICSNSNPFSNFAIKQVAIQLRIPYIVVEGLVEPYLAERFATYLDELSYHYNHAKSVIAVSHENLNLLHHLFKLPQDRGQVIYYGRPPEYFKPKDLAVRDRLRQELSIPSDAVVCFTAARIETRKGYQYQLEAIKQLIHSPVWSQLYFVWVGGGIFEPQLETYLKQSVEQLGITETVKFLGQCSNISDWLNIADIFVFPSQLEGMPICVMEAMAKGLPIIATAISGIPEELGDTGRLLPDPKINPQATIDELIRAIQDWAVNPELCDEVGQVCKQRAEEMFKEERMIDETVLAIEQALLPKGDYVSPGFSIVRPDKAFPNMVVGDTGTCNWTYLRREIPHNWYVDKRQPTVGFASRDEAHILYNTALKFKGKRALEIGCWLGWSACHLALAGIELDVVDPLLSIPEFYESVGDSLKASGVLSRVKLVGGYSPQKVEDLATQLQHKWSLIFIDGNHDAPGPLNDAIACDRLAEDDALILFHDLASPEVAQGLDYLKQKGWQTMVYQTMQIMGVAWRGHVEPIMHQPDPKINWVLPSHLQDYQVSGGFAASNRLKVTFCTCDDPNFTGGPNSWLRRLLPALKLAGIDVNILFFVTTDLVESCPCFRDLQSQGIECQAFRWQTTTEQKIHWLLSQLAENPPDIFVPNMLVAAFYASRWVKAAGVPTVGMLHSEDVFHQSVLRNFVLGEAAYQLSALICVSKFLEHYVHSLLAEDVNRTRDSKTLIRQIPGGVPLPQQLAKPPADCLKLIYVGRLEEEAKQISEVTRALCNAIKAIPKVEAVIVGEGSARASVEQILVEEGEDLPIRLAGLVDTSQIQAVMSESHVLVLLSDYEGLPIALMEAMACGLVPICLRIRGGVSELVEDGLTGLLVNNRGDEFTNAVQRLKNEPELWNRLSKAARAKIEGYYSNEVCTAKWIDLFQTLHKKVADKQNICNPRWLDLPPVEPAFAREDYRQQSLQSQHLSPKIALDAVFFQLYKTGIARVWKSLLEEWQNNSFAKHIVVFDRGGTAPKIPGIRYRTVPAYDYANTEADRAMLQQICDEEGADLFISTYYTTPISTPSVFMAHDMIPELVGANLNHPMWREKNYGIQHASAYITVSEHTARDLVKFFPDISLDSVTVAQNGVDRQIFSPANYDKIDRFKTNYGIYKPYFLIVGAGAGYKNSILFLKAFAQLHSKQGFDIVCTGSGYISDVNFRTYTSGSTVHMLQLSDEELSIAYSGAVALVYPSKYEGFGLPVLEAIACGCPVITCANGAIPEVAGEAAIYVNDEDVDGLANALCEVQKPIVRNSLSFAGLQQAQKFSWSKMAEIVSCTLINATLLPLNLREVNLIIFPDWSQSEEIISEDLEQVIRAIATHPDSNKITLLVDQGNLDEEEVGLILSGVSMNLLMQEDLDISDSAEISLIGQLSEVQWQALLPRIQARIVLENENKEAIAQVKADSIPSCERDKYC